jgi:hypothetical protein
LDIAVQGLPAAPTASEGSTWRPGGDNDTNDYAQVHVAGASPLRFHYTYPGAREILFQGEIIGVGLWDTRFDEAFGYRLGSQLFATVAQGTSAEGPLIRLPEGSVTLHFAIKHLQAFWKWIGG